MAEFAYEVLIALDYAITCDDDAFAISYKNIKFSIYHILDIYEILNIANIIDLYHTFKNRMLQILGNFNYDDIYTNLNNFYNNASDEFKKLINVSTIAICDSHVSIMFYKQFGVTLGGSIIDDHTNLKFISLELLDQYIDLLEKMSY